MEPNESNPKPQSTGGLKLMTIFIAVLLLHVLVIGGFTIKTLLYPANPDNDLAIDKAHKTHVTDTTLGDVPATDTASTDTKTASADADAIVNDTAAPASTASAASTPSPATTPASSNSTVTTTVVTVPATPAAAEPTIMAPAVTASEPRMAEDDSSIAANPPAPSGPVHHGPVVTPAPSLAPPADSAATATTATTSSTNAVAATGGTPYVVKHGDSLARIAHHHHITVDKLRSANSLASDALHIGQKLTIPARELRVAKAGHAAPVADENTVATAEEPAIKTTRAAAPAISEPIAPRAQPVTEADGIPSTLDKSSLAAALPKHAHHAAASAHHLYTVVRGDTLTKIAKRYHTTTSALASANGLGNAGRLSIGQKLHIPSHEARNSATAQEVLPRESEPRTAAKGQLANYVQ